MGLGTLLGRICLIITVFLCPAAAFAAAPALAVYGNLPGFEQAAISPSGDQVAVIATVLEKRSLLIMDHKGRLVHAMGVGDQKVRGLFWAGNGMVLAEVSKTVALGIGFLADKTELQTIVVVPVDGTKPWFIFDNYSVVQGGVRGFYGVRERGGRWYGYFSGITLDSQGKTGHTLVSTKPVLYEVDLQERKYRRIGGRPESDNLTRNWLVGPDGNVAVTFDLNYTSGAWSMRNSDGQRFATGSAPLGDVDLIGFGMTPGSVVYQDLDAEDGNPRWTQVPLAGGPSNEILQNDYIDDAIFDNRTNQLIGFSREGDTPSYQFFDAYRNKVMAAAQKAFPGVSVYLVDSNDTFDRLVVKTSGVGDPGTWWWVDIKSGTANVLGSAYQIADADVAPMRVIRYKAGDGIDIAAVLTLPPGRPAKNLPIVVFPHGGPSSRDYPNFDWWAQAFAVRGYAVLQPNFRGSTGYGVDFQRAGHGEWGRKMQTDMSDGLAHLVKEGIADPKRACIMGASYGGYAALAGVTLQHGVYRCAVSVAGISDVQKMVRLDIAESGENPMVRRALNFELGAGKDLKAVSPIRFVDTVNAPVLLIHGKDDTVVLFDQSNDMAVALRKAGKPVEFVTLPGEDHWLSKSETRMAMLQAATAFVEKHNPPDPAK